MLPLLLADFPTKCSISIRSNLLCFEEIVKRMKLCRNSQYLFWSVLLETVMHYKLCTVKKIYIYIYILTWVKSTLSSNRMSLVFEENFQITRCCCCCVWFVWVFCCFCVVNCYLKKNKNERRKKNTTTVYRLKNYCFLYYWDPKLRLSKANIWFKSFIWCG